MNACNTTLPKYADGLHTCLQTHRPYNNSSISRHIWSAGLSEIFVELYIHQVFIRGVLANKAS